MNRPLMNQRAKKQRPMNGANRAAPFMGRRLLAWRFIAVRIYRHANTAAQ